MVSNNLSPANNGGLAELDQLPDGRGIDRGDGFTYFRGISGQRYRQPVQDGHIPPTIKDPKKELQERVAAKVRVFDLSNEEDLKDYQRVLNDCANGYSQHAMIKEEYDQETKNWRVLMRWYELLLEPRRK